MGWNGMMAKQDGLEWKVGCKEEGGGGGVHICSVIHRCIDLNGRGERDVPL